nr:retrovirus-related Pol polyprotein from transposon TNT 1-94 [Tanacetum cinerariifolium]
MKDPNITMEEYVQYETEKALRNGYMYNWETAKYVNWKNETSLSEYDDGKYNVMSEREALKKRFSKKENFNILSIDKDLFSYDMIFVNDLKLNKDNDEDKIGSELGSELTSLAEDIQCAGSEYHEVHEMHDDVQPNCVVVSDTKYTGDSKMIPYDQYVKDNAEPVRKVAIGYKIPLCLARAKQVQPALYNGHEIVKRQYVPAIVHNLEDTLEIPEITRKKMNEKMKTPLQTHNKINIRPPDYSKEKFLATFTPQTQLTLEQIFWSKDILKMKTESLAEQAKAVKPVRALTAYPPNTPIKLVPSVLPIKRQVKVNIFALIQLFSKFEKTCKMRITPTALKEHFEVIQKALTKEIKEMKAIFDELEAEVDQNAVNRKCDEIERKNLLITNDTLIANCLSREVLYIETNSELNVSIFSKMHDAHTVVQARCMELETELSKLKNKIKKDDHDVMDGPDFDSVFEIKKLKASIQGKDNAIRKLRTQISQLQETRSEADRNLDFRVLDFQITQLTEKVSVLQEQNELFRVENAKVKQHYKELNNRNVHLEYLRHLKESVATIHKIVEESRVERPLDSSLDSACLYTKRSQELVEYVVGTCPKDFNKRDKKQATTPLNRKKQVTFADQDYVIGEIMISRVYYVEGIRHNLFFVGKFYDFDLEVAFRKHSCYVRDTYGIELIKGSRSSNLYTISVEDMIKSSPICLLSKASKNKSWLRHRYLNHLNFGAINDLAKTVLVRGLPRLKFKKDHLCSPCQLGKSNKHTHKPKAENTIMEVLHTLHMDLCGPITPSSTRIDQDTPSTSTLQTIKEAQSHVIPTSVEVYDH